MNRVLARVARCSDIFFSHLLSLSDVDLLSATLTARCGWPKEVLAGDDCVPAAAALEITLLGQMSRIRLPFFTP